jgi:hypothetical protein
MIPKLELASEDASIAGTALPPTGIPLAIS